MEGSKKERDSIKMMHNALNLQPPHSPISPSPPEVEIRSVDAGMQGYQDAGYFEQYEHIFYPDTGATPSTPAPGDVFFGPSHAPPPYVTPQYGFDDFGSWMFSHHVGDAGQGTSGHGDKNDDEDDDQQ